MIIRHSTEMLHNKLTSSIYAKDILVFKTDIISKQKVKVLATVFNNFSAINNWNIDTQDIDNVLRVDAKDNLKEFEIIAMVKAAGFSCEVLTY